MIRPSLLLLLLTLLPLGCRPAPKPPAVEIRVAAAADLQFVLPEIAQVFESANPGTKVATTIGASGNLYAQIHNGAQFDLFLSADEKLPHQLVTDGEAAAGSEFLYALGQLVLWVPHASPLDLTNGLSLLTRPEVRKIAIANPDHAPYGAAAVAALKQAGLYESVSGKLVQGENVAQAAQFLETGAAEAGLISLALASAPKMAERGRYREVPPETYPPLRQAGVVLSATRSPTTAARFRESLLTGAGHEILARLGFRFPPPK